MTTRRQFLAAAAAMGQAGRLKSAPQGEARMGGSPTAFSNRMHGTTSFDIVEHCNSLGLSGVETARPPATLEARQALRAKLDAYGMRVIFNVPLPRRLEDVEAFEAQVRSAKETGAMALHAALTQRRYEQFDTFDAFRQNFEQNQRSVTLAEPILRKHRLRLAIENHKGWRAAEQARWIKGLGSEYVGVCFDFGNNIALCETPDETFRLLGPLAIFCHIKDMAVTPYVDGFLLAEVPFGEGILNLKQMVDSLRQRDPEILFCLEMITRDPLKIPVFTDQYWATFDDSYSPLPGRDLARTLAMVRAKSAKKPLPEISSLAPAERIAAEDRYNLECIDYARKNLNL